MYESFEIELFLYFSLVLYHLTLLKWFDSTIFSKILEHTVYYFVEVKADTLTRVVFPITAKTVFVLLSLFLLANTVQQTFKQKSSSIVSYIELYSSAEEACERRPKKKDNFS